MANLNVNPDPDPFQQPWTFGAITNATGELRIPYQTAGVAGIDSLIIGPQQIDGSTGPFLRFEIVTDSAENCPTDPWFQDQAVRDALRQQWLNTNINAPIPNRQEQPAWIKDLGGGQIEFEALDPNVYVADACGIDYIGDYPTAPAGTIISVHTHGLRLGDPVNGTCPISFKKVDGTPDFGDVLFNGVSEKGDYPTLAKFIEKAGFPLDGLLIDEDGLHVYKVKEIAPGQFVKDGEPIDYGKCGIVD